MVNHEVQESAIVLYNRLVEAINDRSSLERVMMLYSCYILATCGWNKSMASRVLKVARRTLHRWDCTKALYEV